MKVLVLSGPLEQELDYDPRRLFLEECGLSGAMNIPDASIVVNHMAKIQSHRGEEGMGLSAINGGRLRLEKRDRAPSNAFDDDFLKEKLQGKLAIAHGRYSTSGSDNSKKNLQPLRYENKFGEMAIAHNGNLINIKPTRDKLMNEGVNFRSATDTEVIAHLIARSSKPNLEEAIIESLSHVEAAYSFLILTPDRLYAIKDRFGIRPLVYAQYDGGHIVASEDFAFSQFEDVSNVTEVEPGEMIIFERDSKDVKRIQYSKKPDERFCIFEAFYFADPSTRHRRFFHEEFRREAGTEIARQDPSIANRYDVVVPVLDSGKNAAFGLSEETGISYREILKRNSFYTKDKRRSFIAPTLQERESIIKRKFFLRKDLVRDRRILLVDDSIVRSTTAKTLVEWIREAGAKSVGIAIASPPIKYICPNGIDFQNKDEIVASRMPIDEIRKKIKADELIYLEYGRLGGLVKRTYDSGICDGCFSGRYPVEPVNHIRL